MIRVLTRIRAESASSTLGSNLDNLLTRELPKISFIQIRTKYHNNRHRDPNYRRERARKLWKIDIPDFDQMRKDQAKLTPDEMRSKLKEKGIAPPRNWNERELYTPCSIGVMEPYVPGSNEESSSLLDKIKIPFIAGKDRIMKSREVSSIKAFEGEDFNLKAFVDISRDIYIKAHETLAAKDENKIFDYVTEHCFPKMAAGINRHTMVWKYLGDVEEPAVVKVKSGDMLAKGNKFTQITVRFHTKQILAIYDRHGRLIHGSPSDVKEVLEYIVFEKYLANEYGEWRLHDRISAAPSEQKQKDESNKPTLSQQVSKTVVLKNSANM